MKERQAIQDCEVCRNALAEAEAARDVGHLRLTCAPNAHLTLADVRGMTVQPQDVVALNGERGVEVLTRGDGALLALFTDIWRVRSVERQLPEVVRWSSQASWLNDFHSSLMKLALDCRAPASSTTTRLPATRRRCAAVKPARPAPITIVSRGASLTARDGSSRGPATREGAPVPWDRLCE